MNTYILTYCGPGSSVDIATDYVLDGPGIESRWGTRFSAPVQTGPGAHTGSCTMGTGSFPGVKSGRGVTLTPHPLLVPWPWKGRAIPLLPLWAVRSVQSLSACTRSNYLFIPWRRVHLEKLTGSQLVKKFPAFYGTQGFITAVTSARHLPLSWASSIQSKSPYPLPEDPSFYYLPMYMNTVRYIIVRQQYDDDDDDNNNNNNNNNSTKKLCKYRYADYSLARPGRKQATATKL